MSEVTETNNRNTFDIINEAIAPGLASLNDRCKAFDLSMNELALVDWKTGNVEIADTKKVERAYRRIYHSIEAAKKATSSFIEIASLGMAVLHSGDNDRSPIGIPWYSFFDWPSLMLMSRLLQHFNN